MHNAQDDLFTRYQALRRIGTPEQAQKILAVLAEEVERLDQINRQTKIRTLNDRRNPPARPAPSYPVVGKRGRKAAAKSSRPTLTDMVDRLIGLEDKVNCDVHDL